MPRSPVSAAVAVGCQVYRWTAPAPGTVGTTTRGERLVAAFTTAAAVVAIGAYLAGGIKDVGPSSEGPAPVPTATRTGSAP
ncbi:hypothetical protein [Streptomyces sp. NPDC001388]|uniref:hypothetical protein n=1 Tax=Streptomyces sp. NPDC001388 TaxID=3364568 RepID=UPI003692FCA8